MAKATKNMAERRRFLRLETPVKITYTIPESERTCQANAKDLSVYGLRLETREEGISESSTIEISLDIPGAPNPVHAKGKVVWKRKLSLEDTAPFDIGLEFINIEEDNKNTFLKFLSDSIYKLGERR